MTDSATGISLFLQRHLQRQKQRGQYQFNRLLGRRCAGCRRASQSPICATCLASIKKPRDYCQVCGVNLSAPSRVLRCRDCLTLRPAYERLYYLGNYEGHLREWIISAKIGQRAEAIESLRALQYEKLTELGADTYWREYDNFTLLPMPIPKGRFMQRGFNLPALLALELSKITGLSVAPSDLVTLPWRTQKQARLSKKQRQQRRIPYQINDKPHQLPKNIIIVDDVVTTGQTIEQFATILRENGAKRVIAYVLSRRQPS